jgi:hypothetical protein
MVRLNCCTEPRYSFSTLPPELLLIFLQVPRVGGFSEVEQLHGEIILQLKQKWVCEKHQGEHGQAGACYIDSAGNHIGLNNRKLKIWASAIVSRPICNQYF